MLLVACVLFALAAVSSSSSPPLPVCSNGRCKNVVWIVSDDMRADISAYGVNPPGALTPNLEALAASGLLFRNAYCQISVCSPSRQSFMTGRRPDRSGVWNFIDANPLNSSAIPGHFRDNGYLSLGLGKTFHEDNGAWNADAYWNTSVLPYFPYASNVCPHGNEGGGHCTEPDEAIWDASLLNATLEYLSFASSNYNATGRPFFLMTGFRDPHAPWAAPPRMAALYNESSLATAEYPILPAGIPLIAYSEQLIVMLENGTVFPFNRTSAVPTWVQRDQRHAYFAAISYVDEHVGAILARLRAAGLEEETIVVFSADHGYLLGENGYWEKKSNWDQAVRVPLIIRDPSKPAAAGTQTSTYFDLVDLFPTLAALVGLPPPPPDSIDGQDLSALWDDPSAMLKAEAFHQFPACGMTQFDEVRADCNNVPRGLFDYMGYSYRNTSDTGSWRYTVWLSWDNVTLTSNWDGPSQEELYNHTNDESKTFNVDDRNLAEDLPTVAAACRARLRTVFDQ